MTLEIRAALAAPFPIHQVKWRLGRTNADKTSGLALAYIDARDVMNRLDDVLGPECWQTDFKEVAGRVICMLSVRFGDSPIWVRKSDGAGDTAGYEVEKAALSDAFKRSAVHFGIGRYLYAVETTWVPITMRGKTAVISPEGKSRLDAILEAPHEHEPSQEDRFEELEDAAKAPLEPPVPAPAPTAFDPEARKANPPEIPPERRAPVGPGGDDLIKELGIYRRCFKLVSKWHSEAEIEGNSKIKFKAVNLAIEMAGTSETNLKKMTEQELRKVDEAITELETPASPQAEAFS